MAPLIGSSDKFALLRLSTRGLRGRIDLGEIDVLGHRRVETVEAALDVFEGVTAGTPVRLRERVVGESAQANDFDTMPAQAFQQRQLGLTLRAEMGVSFLVVGGHDTHPS